jgi:hypothetical protein
MKRYFAYGTLLDVPSMQAFAPSARPAGVMRLDGYELGFAETRLKGKGGCWLVPKPGAVTYGLHYTLSAKDMARMDAASGIHEGLWVHKPITVTDANGGEVATVTYTIPGDPPAFRPSEDYVRPIRRGIAKLELPPAYAELIGRIIEAARNPE